MAPDLAASPDRHSRARAPHDRAPNDRASRDRTARRLLTASARHTLDPATEVDWAAPLDPGTFFAPPRRLSLYGTPEWDGLSPAQRIELSRHEVASMASVGIWFETVLMQLIARYVYDLDPRTAHVQYALTEVADECRHSIMFADLITKLGTPWYGPGRVAREQARVMKTVAAGPAMFAAILLGEEILDTLQREAMADESLQPLVRQVSRLHVTEEARHVRYAREELARQVDRMPAAARPVVRLVTARTAHVVVRRLVHPQVYRAVGLDPAAGVRAARRNPDYRESLRWAGSGLVSYLDGLGLIGGPGVGLWRASGLLDR